MISSIIVSKAIEDDIKAIDFINDKFPKAYIVNRETGKVIRNPKKCTYK